MNNTVINFNTDPKLKSEAMKVLDEMGLTLSAALNASLRKIITERKIEFIAPKIPNARLRKSIRDARQEYKQRKTAGPFSSIKEMRKSLEL